MTDEQTLRKNLRQFFDRSSPGQLSILCHELAEAFLRKHYAGALDLSRIATELDVIEHAQGTVRALQAGLARAEASLREPEPRAPEGFSRSE